MKKLLTILLLFITISLNATVYYVATTGNDGAAGTIIAPWATFQKAINTLVAGDTVYFRGGTYAMTLGATISPKAAVPVGNDGETGNPISYFNYPGEVPIFDGTNSTGESYYNNALAIEYADHLSFRGLIFRNWHQIPRDPAPPMVIAVGGPCNTYMRYENITVYNIDGRGFSHLSAVGDTDSEPDGYTYAVGGESYLRTSDSTYFINCDAYNCYDHLSSPAGNGGDGYKSGQWQGGYINYDGCRAWNFSDDGIDNNGSGVCVVENCWLFLGGNVGGTTLEGNGMKIGAVNAGTDREADGYEGNTYVTRFIQNNIIAFNLKVGMHINMQQHSPMYIFNNFIYKNYTGVTEASSGVVGTPLYPTFKNNIAYGHYDPDEDVIIQYSIPETNSWIYCAECWGHEEPNPLFTITDADFVLLDSTSAITELTAARKSDNSLPYTSFGKIRPSSDLVNGGTDVGLAFYGTNPDLGWAEYTPGPQIIANHSIVADYANIPQFYIDSVKKMWLSYPGESHASGIIKAMDDLMDDDATYAVSTRYVAQGGTPEGNTSDHLRVSSAVWSDYSNATGGIYTTGEEDWWTSATARTAVKRNLDYSFDNDFGLSAIGFGWCWDMTGFDPNLGVSTGTDPVTGNHWYGVSQGSLLADPWYSESDSPWGLDVADNDSTGNNVNLDTYLSATQEYIDYCITNDIPTKVFFTTGPIDYPENIDDEGLYQRELKHHRIRDYVITDSTLIFYDYADILSYDNDGTGTVTDSWNAITFPMITVNNKGNGDYGHIGEYGRLRLAKGLWWMLARIAGWDGGTAVYSNAAEEPDPEADFAPNIYAVATTGVKYNKVTSGGSVISDGGSTITDRGICWGTSANPAITGSHLHTTGTTGSYSLIIAGLTSNTTYHVRSFATNSVGTSYGDDIEFKTKTFTVLSNSVNAYVHNGKTMIMR